MRTALILAIVVLTGTGGELSLTHAMKRIGEVHQFSPRAILRVVGQALLEGWLWVGVGLMAVSFFSFLAMLSWYPVSFVVPATSLAYVAGAIGAKFLLGEHLNATRWAGVLFICFGVALAWVDRMPAMPNAALWRLIFRDAIFIGPIVPLVFYVVGAIGAWRFFRLARLPNAAPWETRDFTPPVSILKPVRGLDREAYENFASFCRQEYPEYEIVFAAGDENDPAVPVIRELMLDFPNHPGRSIRLLLGAGGAGVNDKVAKLCLLAQEARHNLLVITDSDVHVPPGYLAGVVAPFSNPKVGVVTALYRASGAPAVLGKGQALGATMDAVGSSGSFAGSVFVARAVEGLKFAMGSTMATKRERLAEIGGFEALLDLHSDDYEFGRRIAARGFSVELAAEPVDMEFPSQTLAGYLRHELRWMVGIRHIRAGGHLGLAMTQGLPWVIAAAAISPNGATAAAWIASYLIVRLTTSYIVGVWGLRDPVLRRRLWLLPLHDFFAFFTWLASFAVNRIEWRGLTFTLEKGRMVPVTPRAERR